MTDQAGDVASNREPSPPPHLIAPTHFISVAAARRRYLAAGFPRTEKAIQGYAKNGTLIKHDEIGPNGRPKFFIDPASIEQHIAQLAQLHHLDDDTDITPPIAIARDVSPPVANGDEASPVKSVTPERKPAGQEPARDADDRQPVANARERSPSHAMLRDETIFEHPYVVRLEGEVTELKKLYRDQVARTETIQREAFDQLIELQRSSQIAQSQTLADFFIRTRDFLLGRSRTDAVNEDEIK